METKESRFRILKQGYDRFEVDRSMDELETKINMLETKLATYQKQVDYTNKQLEATNQKYQALVQQLSIREKAADEISRLALQEANSIIDTANTNADIIVREALSTARLLLVELARISNQTASVKTDLKDRIIELSQLIEDFQLPDIPNMDWLQSYNKINSDD